MATFSAENTDLDPWTGDGEEEEGQEGPGGDDGGDDGQESPEGGEPGDDDGDGDGEPGEGDGDDEGDGEGQPGQPGEGQPQPGQPQPGQPGQPGEGQPGEGQGQPQPGGGADPEAAGGFGGECGAGAGGDQRKAERAREEAIENGFLDPDEDPTPGEIDEAREEMKEIQKEMDENPSASRGFTPGNFRRAIEEYGTAIINWQERLRSSRFAELLTQMRQEQTYKRPARITSSMRQTVGMRRAAILPVYRGREFTIGCIVDTSGSVSNMALAITATEIASLVEANNIKRVDVIAVDAAVNTVRQCFSREDVEASFMGGGGTLVGLGLTAMEEQVSPAPATTAIISDFEFGSDFGDWPEDTTLDNLIFVCVPAGGGKKPTQGCIDQMYALADRYDVPHEECIVVDLDEYSG